MSLNFKLVPRKNPLDPTAPPKYYAKVVVSSKRDLKSLSKKVASHTTMSAPDVYGVLMALEEEVIVALQEGAQVELGNLCIMYPSVQSDGAETEEAFNTVSHITRKTIKVRPKLALSRQMAEVPVEKVD